jgi:ABC-type glycerol-3-phosphate transport system substrate-binding protein
VEAIATGNAPDVVLFPQELIKRYLDKVSLISYTTIPQRTFMDTYVQEAEMYMTPNGIFAIPFYIDPLVMYWNRDLFGSAGIANPPKLWSEFPALAIKLSQSDVKANIIKSAFSFGEYKNVNNAKAILSALFIQAGTPVVSYTNNLLRSYLYSNPLNSVEVPAVSVLRFYTDYSNPKKTVYSWNRSLSSSKQSFLSEDLATYFGFASEATDIANKNPNLNFDVAMIPQVSGTANKSTFGEIYGFAFMKSSVNLTAAYNTVAYLTSTDIVKNFLQMADVSPARRDIISAGVSDPTKTIFYNSALIAHGWIDPDSSMTNSIFQNMVEDISTGKLDINDSVQKASTQLDNLFTQ